MSEHDTPIKTPQQLIVAIVLSFVVPIVVIVLLTKYIGSMTKVGAGSDALTPEAVAERIKPVGRVLTEPPAGVASAAAAAGPKKVRAGADVYKAQCAACHAAGVLGSPKFGDKAAWAGRIGKGYDALLQSVLKGKGAMGAQGGGAYSDAEIGEAMKVLVNSAGGSL
ncbi:CycB Cytochrome c5 [Burkholderiales bacterium]|jgi:cytochrome c5